MLFEYQPEDFLRVAETLEWMSSSVTELYPDQRDALLVACAMLRTVAQERSE